MIDTMPQQMREMHADVYRFHAHVLSARDEQDMTKCAAEMGRIEFKHNSKACAGMLLAIWEDVTARWEAKK